MGSINVGLIGVGNCASSLVQGVAYYADRAEPAIGLTHPICAGYAIADVRFTAAFDVDAAKIGRDLSETIWLAPNNALRFAEVPHLSVPVLEGTLSDGVGRSAAGRIDASGSADVAAIADHLSQSETQVLVNFLPVGSQHASERYAEAALRAGCAFINCMPAEIARSAEWRRRFREAGLPLLGDDLKSQFGATLVHHGLVDLLERNGVRLRSTYQLAAGGNMDFLNLQDPKRVSSKKATKIQGIGGANASATGVHFGAEYIPFFDDRKLAYIRIEAETFGGTPFELELRMSVEDSPSAAGNVLDAIRYVKRAMDLGRPDLSEPISALLMKAPPQPMSEADALRAMRALLEE